MTLTLMTLTTLSPKQPVSIVNRKSHYPSKNCQKGWIVFCRERRRKMPLEQEKVVPITLFTPSEGKNKRGKRQNERGKTRIFLIYFVKILIKRARKLGQSEGDSVRFNSIKRGKQKSSINDYQTDYQHNTINTTFFQNNFQKLYRVIKGQCH